LPTSTSGTGFARTNYTFAGWNTAADGSGTLYAVGSPYFSATDSTVTLYVVWVENVALIFNSEGGSSVAGVHLNGEATYGAVPGWPTSPTNDPVRAGYTFAGWFVEEIDGSPVASIPATGTTAVDARATQSITLHAHWTEDADVTIDFIAGVGGTIEPTGSVTVPPATGVIAPRTASVSTGYTFTNWTNGAGTVVSTNPVFTPAQVGGVWVADTYTAHFSGISILVSFDSNGGSAALPSTINVTFGDVYGSLPLVTRAGFTFNGWWTAQTGGTQVTAFTVVTDVTDPQKLFAHWTENVYPVDKNFGVYDGSNDTTARIDYGHSDEFVRLVDNATGQPVDPKYYVVTNDNGTTVITLTNDYLKNLPAGNYYFTAEFSNGKSEPIFLQIPAKDSGKGGLPGTGDSSTLLLVSFAELLTAAGLFLLVVPRMLRRRRDQHAN
jgi:uncharacterized repeat protein (TIGR02543 family)